MKGTRKNKNLKVLHRFCSHPTDHTSISDFYDNLFSFLFFYLFIYFRFSVYFPNGRKTFPYITTCASPYYTIMYNRSINSAGGVQFVAIFCFGFLRARDLFLLPLHPFSPKSDRQSNSGTVHGAYNKCTRTCIYTIERIPPIQGFSSIFFFVFFSNTKYPLTFFTINLCSPHEY